MRIAVVGSRDFNDAMYMYQVLDDIIARKLPDVVIVSSNNPGADTLAIEYAQFNGIPYVECEINREKYGRDAFRIRNEQIVEESDFCVVFWNGESSSIQHLIDLCKMQHIGVQVIPIEPKPKRFSQYSGKQLLSDFRYSI